MNDLRWEGDRSADAAATLLLREIICVITSARCSTEGVLLLVGEAAVAELLLLAFFLA